MIYWLGFGTTGSTPTGWHWGTGCIDIGRAQDKSRSRSDFWADGGNEGNNSTTTPQIKTRFSCNCPKVRLSRAVVNGEHTVAELLISIFVCRNDEIPLLFRVPRAEFALDPRIKASRQVQFQDEIEKVYRKYEWDGIRSVIACEKIQKHFLDTIETHHRNVKDLEHTVEVHTFRHRFLTPAFLDVCRMNQEVLASEKAFGDEIAKFGNKNTGKSKSTMQRVKRFYAKDLIGEYAGKKYDVKTAHAIRQLEDLLQKRYTRECEVKSNWRWFSNF